MKEIELTQGQVALVDDADYDYLSQFGWHAHWDGKMGGFYARRTVRSGLKWTKVHMHRVVLSRMLGRELTREERVDHINHNTLDNRRENLRLASHAENLRNGRKRNNNTSGVTGVTWHKRDKKWYARIMVNGKRIHLGCYDDLDEAKSMRLRAQEYYFGEFQYDPDKDVQTVNNSRPI